MDTGRRGFLNFAASALLIGFPQSPRSLLSRAPEPATFEAGDLIWPRPRGAFIPYTSRAGQESANDAALWKAERAEYLSHSKVERPIDAERRELLRKMSYPQFKAMYLSDATPGEPTLFGGRFPLSVGHVGVVAFEPFSSSDPHVIEAVRPRVRAVAYDVWLAQRKNELVWHGRLKVGDRTERARIADRARWQVDKPYAFFNFNLADDTSFYCSKLVWFCVRESLSLVLDDRADPVRRLWFSPKQLMKSPHVDLLFRPSEAARY